MSDQLLNTFEEGCQRLAESPLSVLRRVAAGEAFNKSKGLRVTNESITTDTESIVKQIEERIKIAQLNIATEVTNFILANS